MNGVSLLIKPAGSLCNMRCRYCFYREERQGEAPCEGLMPLDTLEAAFRKLLSGVQGPCNIVFQGGEPTLCGLDFFREAVNLEKRYAAPGAVIANAIQTNGLLIDDDWAAFLAKERFLTGISLDGTPFVHDKHRKDADENGTHERVMEAIRILRRHGAAFNVLSVVTADSCRNARAVYEFFDRCGFLWQQYIPALEPYHDAEKRPWSLTPALYAGFLKTTFELWYRDVSCGKPVYNRYFDNLVGLLCGRLPEACDMRGFCSPQYVIEADGSVYPCDFYAVDAWRLGSVLEDSAETLCAAAQPFLKGGTSLCDECRSCPWLRLCRGGCRRRRENSRGRDALCAAYREFFAFAYPRLAELAVRVSARQR